MHRSHSRRFSLASRLLSRLRVEVLRRLWGADIHQTVLLRRKCYIDRTWPRGVHIGQDCVIERDAIVLTHDMTRGLFLDTSIGANTVIRARAIVMPGVSVGSGSIIEEGAVVTKNMPPNSRAKGNPATICPIDSES